VLITLTDLIDNTILSCVVLPSCSPLPAGALQPLVMQVLPEAMLLLVASLWIGCFQCIYCQCNEMYCQCDVMRCDVMYCQSVAHSLLVCYALCSPTSTVKFLRPCFCWLHHDESGASNAMYCQCNVLPMRCTANVMYCQSVVHSLLVCAGARVPDSTGAAVAKYPNALCRLSSSTGYEALRIYISTPRHHGSCCGL
jgi:hypothetical protein